MAEFTSKQSQTINEARQEFSRTGFPEKVAALDALIEGGAAFSKVEAFLAGPDTVEMPPLSGKGSGVEAWRAFAATKGMDSEALSGMTKEDIVEALKAEGVVAE